MPRSEGNVPSKRSCLRCHERKVRCDREHPCGRCLQAKVKCSFPENKRAPRKLNRPPIATIFSQHKQLEEEVERLRASPDTNDQNTTSRQQPSCEPGQRAHLQSSTPDTPVSASGSVTREKGGYRGQTGASIHRHQVARGQSSNVARAPNDIRESTIGHLTSSPIGILGLSSEPGAEARHDGSLQPLQILALWDMYKEKVAPMIALLHKATVEAMIHDVCKKPDLKRETAVEALIQAICFSAIVSSTPEQCMVILGQDREVCIRTYRLAVEQTLTQANLIGTQDTQVLQAAVLFLLCLRGFDSRLAWAQTAIVIRVAQRQRVHRDGQFCGLIPFNTEMRCRLWWHICILDMLCSEDEGTDTQIRPEMFDTKIPSNIDIDNLTPDISILSPAPSGFTDVTLCIIQCEMMTNLYWAGINLNPNSTHSPMPQRESILCSLATRIEEQYLREFDLNIPIQWLTAVIARLSLSKARVVSLLSNSRPGEVPIATNDEIFQMAVEIVKFASLIQKNEPTARWAWLCKSYKQRHTVAFILSELCIRPITPETNQAWELATEMYSQWEKEGYIQDSVLQTTLSRLMERATIARAKKLESRGGRLGYRASLPVPRSIVQESYRDTAPLAELDVNTSSALGLEGMGDLLDEGSPFNFSAMDWLPGPLL